MQVHEHAGRGLAQLAEREVRDAAVLVQRPLPAGELRVPHEDADGDASARAQVAQVQLLRPVVPHQRHPGVRGLVPRQPLDVLGQVRDLVHEEGLGPPLALREEKLAGVLPQDRELVDDARGLDAAVRRVFGLDVLGGQVDAVVAVDPAAQVLVRMAHGRPERPVVRVVAVDHVGDQGVKCVLGEMDILSGLAALVLQRAEHDARPYVLEPALQQVGLVVVVRLQRVPQLPLEEGDLVGPVPGVHPLPTGGGRAHPVARLDPDVVVLELPQLAVHFFALLVVGLARLGFRVCIRVVFRVGLALLGFRVIFIR